MDTTAEAVAEAREALSRGRSIRILGQRLEGRTHVLRALLRELDARGTAVVEATGELAAEDSPGYTLALLRSQLGLARKAPDLQAGIDELAAAIPADAVLALDDPHLMDELSLRVISTVRRRRGLRLVTAELLGHRRSHALPARWPEHTVRLRDRSLSEVAELMRGALGGGVSAATAARAYAKTGGNVGLVLAVTEAARDTGRLVRAGDDWQIRGDSLWSEDLSPLVDDLLDTAGHGLDGLLEWLGGEGSTPTNELPERFRGEPLRLAVQRRVAVYSEEHGVRTLRLWPPLLAERFAAGPEEEHPHPGAPAAALAPPAPARPQQTVLIARAFAERAASGASSALHRWLLRPSPEHAVAYLGHAIGVPGQAEQVAAVMRGTIVGAGEATEDSFEFVFQHAQWLIFDQEQPAAGAGLLTAFAERHPDWRDTCRAAAELVEMMRGEPLPADPAPLDGPDPVGLLRTRDGLFALARGDLAGMNRAIDRGGELRRDRRLRSYLRPIVHMLNGQLWASIELANEGLAEAVRQADREGYSVLSYITSAASSLLGDEAATAERMDAGVAVGLPRLANTAVYAALLNMEAITAHLRGEPLQRESYLREAEALGTGVGPFAAMGADLSHAIITAGSDPGRLDELISQSVDARAALGYRLGAIQAATAALAAAPCPGVSARLTALLADAPLPVFTRIARLAELLSGNDAAALDAWVGEQGPGQDRAHLARQLSSAARIAEQDGEPDRAARLTRLARTLFDGPQGTAPPPEQPIGRPAAALSQREQQVALLGQRLSNAEIAERLGISRRTVENHIANAMRKAGAGNRGELAGYAAGQPAGAAPISRDRDT